MIDPAIELLFDNLLLLEGLHPNPAGDGPAHPDDAGARRRGSKTCRDTILPIVSLHVLSGPGVYPSFSGLPGVRNLPAAKCSGCRARCAAG